MHEQTELGGVYLQSLLRTQLLLAGRLLLVVVLTLGTLPLLFYVFPGLAALEAGGVPVAWLLLGVLAYPFLVVLGWRYVTSVERNEADFIALVEEHE